VKANRFTLDATEMPFEMLKRVRGKDPAPNKKSSAA
jgi:hypothetical protein